MADKLSWTELRKTLASRAGVSEKKAGAFLNAFQAQLIEALKSDKQVKINGLGTFRVQTVAPRKSVDVTTGEEILIEGYNKVAFTPEAGVKELIESQINPENEDTVMNQENDPIQKLGAQANEIVDLLGDLGQSPEKAQTEQPVETPEPVAEEPKPFTVPEPEAPYVAPSFTMPSYVNEDDDDDIVVQKPRSEESHTLRNTLICLVVLLLLMMVGYFFFRSQITGFINSLITNDNELLVAPADTTAQIVSDEDPDSYEKSLIPEGAISQEQILAEFLEASGDGSDVERSNAQELTYAGWITEEPMHEASRLTWMSKRYYGAKIYWPYLFDTNRDRFDDPNVIEVGTPIRVPKLTAAQRDTTNAQTMATIERLRKQAEARMK